LAKTAASIKPPAGDSPLQGVSFLLSFYLDAADAVLVSKINPTGSTKSSFWGLLGLEKPRPKLRIRERTCEHL
jgi:hypothetical protein